jgi:hypothetical protein
MYKLTYAENNNLVKKNVGGWGGTVGSNTRGDFDKKGWTQAGGLVITPTDQLMGPVSACNCGGFPLGGMGLEQAANVSRCCHGQPPVYNSSRPAIYEPFKKCVQDNNGKKVCDDCEWHKGNCEGTCVEPGESCSGTNSICTCR